MESAWNPTAHNPRSHATGLAQFLPTTWATWGIDGDHDGHADPRNPLDAIPTQAAYLCHLITDVTNHPGLTGDTLDLALAAYNAGPGNVHKYRGIPPFPETNTYVTRIRQLANTTYATPTGTSDKTQAAVVIQKARDQVGKTWYAWGGGTLNGPSQGAGPDHTVTGFDCSSLIRYAYYQGANHTITLPRTAQQQYDVTQSQQVAVDQLQPGDLLFWGNAGRIYHVALYIGDGRMIEAPESGKLITESDVRINDDYVGATRVVVRG